jgi:hypothetical protein
MVMMEFGAGGDKGLCSSDMTYYGQLFNVHMVFSSFFIVFSYLDPPAKLELVSFYDLNMF